MLFDEAGKPIRRGLDLLVDAEAAGELNVDQLRDFDRLDEVAKAVLSSEEGRGIRQSFAKDVVIPKYRGEQHALPELDGIFNLAYMWAAILDSNEWVSCEILLGAGVLVRRRLHDQLARRWEISFQHELGKAIEGFRGQRLQYDEEMLRAAPEFASLIQLEQAYEHAVAGLVTGLETTDREALAEVGSLLFRSKSSIKRRERISDAIIRVQFSDWIQNYDKMKARADQLVRWVGMRGMSPRGSAFLKRLGSAFLAGLDWECVVLCRSILDVELKSHISNDLCIETMPTKDPRYKYTLNDRMKVAELRGILSEHCARLAHKVRQDANDFLHERIASPNATSYVQSTLEVIEALCGSRSTNA